MGVGVGGGHPPGHGVGVGGGGVQPEESQYVFPKASVHDLCQKAPAIGQVLQALHPGGAGMVGVGVGPPPPPPPGGVGVLVGGRHGPGPGQGVGVGPEHSFTEQLKYLQSVYPSGHIGVRL